MYPPSPRVSFQMRSVRPLPSSLTIKASLSRGPANRRHIPPRHGIEEISASQLKNSICPVARDRRLSPSSPYHTPRPKSTPFHAHVRWGTLLTTHARTKCASGSGGGRTDKTARPSVLASLPRPNDEPNEASTTPAHHIRNLQFPPGQPVSGQRRSALMRTTA